MRAVFVLPAVVILALALVPMPAVAQPTPEGTDPIDEVIPYGNDFVVLDPPATQPSPMVPMDEAPWKVVYLNFDGATLNGGGNNSKTNNTDLILSSTLDYPALDWTKLGGKEQGSKAVVDELKLVFLKFAVKFVTERPTEGDYTMAMVGGTGDGCKKGGPGTVGIAPLDCKNTNLNDVCLIFGDEMNGSVRKLAFVIAHELGHTFGLEHVTDPKGIMYPALTPEVCCWVSAPISGGSSCGRTTQDAEKVLEENVGVGKQDTQPPLVWFLRPGDGAILPPDFTFEVVAGDDLGVHHVTFFLDGAKLMEMDGPPYTHVVTGMADGQHVLKAEVHDWVKLTSSAQVTFTVDAGCVVDGTCDGGTGGIGRPCEAGDDCTSGVCAVNAADEGRCISTCDGAAEAVCPTGLTCQQLEAPTGATWACLPAGDDWTLHLAGESSGGGGGCAVSPGLPPVRRAAPIGLVLLAATGGLLAARRRRRR
jgi:hypothetical protein